MSFHHIQPDSQHLEIALTRTDLQNVSGNGLIGILRLGGVQDLLSDKFEILDSNTVQVLFTSSDIVGLDNQEVRVPIRTDSTTAKVYRWPNGLATPDSLHVLLTVFPNPARDQVTIRWRGTHLKSAQLTSITGAIIATAIPTNQQQLQLQTAGLARGIYFLRFQTSEGLLVRKLVIE